MTQRRPTYTYTLSEYQESLPKSYCTCKLRYVFQTMGSRLATLWVDWHCSSPDVFGFEQEKLPSCAILNARK